MHCYHDGQPFDGKPFQIPLADLRVQPLAGKSRGRKYKLAAMSFCGPSCGKAHLREKLYDSHILLLFALYCKEVYGLDAVATALDRRRLAVYNVNGDGLTIEDFRSGNTPLVVEESVSVSSLIHTEGAQVNYLPITIEARGLGTGYGETPITTLGPVPDDEDEEEK
jgi:hypothetical protein